MLAECSGKRISWKNTIIAEEKYIETDLSREREGILE